MKPSRASTWAMVMAARTAAKSMAGRDGSGCDSLCSCRVCRSCLAAFAGLGELAVAFGMDGLVVAEEFVVGRDVTDGTVQADVVVMRDVVGDDAAGILERQRHLDADAIALEGFVPAFDLAVGLRVVGRGADMGHAGDADEFLEVLGDELGAVVGDDAWRDAGELFAGALQDGFHVDFLHFFANFPVNDEAAVAIEDASTRSKRYRRC